MRDCERGAPSRSLRRNYRHGLGGSWPAARPCSLGGWPLRSSPSGCRSGTHPPAPRASLGPSSATVAFDRTPGLVRGDRRGDRAGWLRRTPGRGRTCAGRGIQGAPHPPRPTPMLTPPTCGVLPIGVDGHPRATTITDASVRPEPPRSRNARNAAESGIGPVQAAARPVISEVDEGGVDVVPIDPDRRRAGKPDPLGRPRDRWHRGRRSPHRRVARRVSGSPARVLPWAPQSSRSSARWAASREVRAA